MWFDGNLYVEIITVARRRRIKRPRNRFSPTFSNRKDLLSTAGNSQPSWTLYNGPSVLVPGQTRIHKEVSDTRLVPRSRGTGECECRLSVVWLSVFPSCSRGTTSRAFVIVVSVGCSWLACREEEEEEEEEKEEDFSETRIISHLHHAVITRLKTISAVTINALEKVTISRRNRREWDGMSQFRIFRDLKWIRWPLSIYSL